MEVDQLPWEASRAALDLMRYANDVLGIRPMVRQVRWFWRVTLAAPDAPMDERARLALELAMELAMEAIDELTPELSNESLTSIQWRLVFQPWRDSEDEQAWLALPEELRSRLFHSTPAEVRDLFEDLDAVRGKKKKKKRQQ